MGTQCVPSVATRVVAQIYRPFRIATRASLILDKLNEADAEIAKRPETLKVKRWRRRSRLPQSLVEDCNERVQQPVLNHTRDE